MGVPNPRFLATYNRMVAVPEEQIPPWAMNPIKAVGQSVPPPDKAGTPQGKLLAARGAEVDAKRKLAEQIKGLQLSSNTLVRDFVTEHDEIRTSVDAIISNAAVEKTRFSSDGTAEVTVLLPGMQVWEAVHEPAGVPFASPPSAIDARPGPGAPPPRGNRPPRTPAGRRPAPPLNAPPPPQENESNQPPPGGNPPPAEKDGNQP